MPSFPSLDSGSSFQLPHSRVWSVRVVRNEFADGRFRWYADHASRKVAWTLQYTALTREEKLQWEEFFGSCRGRTGTFSFCEPAANLFSYSEDLSAAGWERPALWNVESGVADPTGGQGAFRLVNGSQTQAIFGQQATTGSGVYCVSAWLRGPDLGTARLQIGSAASPQSTETERNEWVRRWTAGTPEGSTALSGIVLAAGQGVDIYGLQLEIQLAPSSYKPTLAGGGYFAKARFDQDELTFIETEPGRFSTRMRIIAEATR